MEFVEQTENPVDYCNMAYFMETVQYHNISVVCMSEWKGTISALEQHAFLYF